MGVATPELVEKMQPGQTRDSLQLLSPCHGEVNEETLRF